jgi:pSer/pThr/pTyr-binding forkhead associated (FHA) protein
LVEGRLIIGRGEGGDISLDDPGLSRVHASIYREGDRVWILDEGSTSGSYVNGAPVPTTGAALADRDKISVGDYTVIWVSIARAGKASSGGGVGPQMSKSAMAALAATLVIVIGGLVVGLLSTRDSKPINNNTTQRRNDPPPSTDAPPKLTGDGSVVENSNASVIITPPSQSGKRYLQMTEVERNEFIYARARHVSRMMGNREYQFTDEVLPYIKQYLDNYARRVGNRSSSLWGEDLNSLFARARRHAPYIIRSFNAQGVPAVVGLYIPMIESEYHPCLQSPVGARGLFQFMPDTARGYGVDPADRCDVQKMAPAAAKYMKHRIAEFGSDAMSVALGIAGYNRSPDSVRRDLQDVLNSGNKERSFWTLVVNSDKLDRFFQNENVKYVPKFFAAAIVGETPSAFGLDMNPLSTYTHTDDGT